MGNTLITGVAGTTGSLILGKIINDLEEGRKIFGVDNFFRGTLDNIERFFSNPNFIFLEADFRDIDAEFLSHNQIDEIYHMAAVVPTKYFYERPDLTFEVNCLGTIELFNRSRESGTVKRFIEGSSSEIYGHITDFPCKEIYATTFDSVEYSTRWSYAEGKLLVEHYLNHFAGEMERVCHLRFANTYGIGDMDDNHIIPYIINKLFSNEDIHLNVDAKKFFRTFLNNEDSSEACVALMRSGRNGVAYNVGSDEEISIEDLFDKIKLIYEIVTKKNYTGKVFYDIERRGDPRRRVLDTTRLKEDTGFVPKVSLLIGIEDMIKKFMEDHSE